MLFSRHPGVPVFLVFCVFFLAGCGIVVRGVVRGAEDVWESQLLRQGQHGKLSEKEKIWAKTAWQYFINNYNETGLVNAVDSQPNAGMWHVADTIAATIAARELKVIKPCEFDARISSLLHFLNNMPLFDGILPNKIYSTQNGNMVDYAGNPVPSGWSALDTGRLLIWLKILKTRYPQYAEYADNVVLRWNFCQVINDCGLMYGSAVMADQRVITYQEGRLGYEEYAAKGFRMWGFGTDMASQLTPYKTVRIYGIEIPYDSRDKQDGGAVSAVLTSPFIMDGMEFNWDRATDNFPGVDSYHTDTTTARIAYAVYQVQEERFNREHVFTARTDHPFPDPPYFIYDTVFGEGYPWNVMGGDGAYQKDAALVSTRAAFGMWALWKTPYTDRLIKVVACLNDSEKGWYEGRRERTGGYVKFLTIGTNAAVLEALLYKVRGKLFPGNARPGYYENFIADPFNWNRKCFPAERQPCPVAPKTLYGYIDSN